MTSLFLDLQSMSSTTTSGGGDGEKKETNPSSVSREEKAVETITDPKRGGDGNNSGTDSNNKNSSNEGMNNNPLLEKDATVVDSDRDFVKDDEEACVVSASQMEKVNNLDIQGFNNWESVLIPKQPSQPSEYVISSSYPIQPSKVSGEASEIFDNNQATQSPPTTPTKQTSKHSSPAIIAASPKIIPPTPGSFSPNLRPIANPKQQTIEIDHIGGINHQDDSTQPLPQPVTQQNTLSQPVNLPPRLSMVEASIIQSQVMESDNDSNDVVEDYPMTSPEIRLSQKATSVFSPSITRYRSMASPNMVYYHTQPTQKSDENTQQIEETEKPKSTKEKRRERARKREKIYAVEESSEEEPDEDELFSRSLFVKDKLIIETMALKQVNQQTESFKNMRASLEKQNKQLKEMSATNNRTLTNDDVLEYLQSYPAEQRKQNTAHNRVASSGKSSHTESNENKPPKKQKTSNNSPPKAIPQQISPHNTHLLNSTTDNRPPSQIILSPQAMNTSSRTNHSSRVVSSKKVNYRKWLEMI